MASVDQLEHGEDIRERAFRFGCNIIRFCEKLDALGGIAKAMMPQLRALGTSFRNATSG